jgi:hypothetical protein
MAAAKSRLLLKPKRETSHHVTCIVLSSHRKVLVSQQRCGIVLDH